jgi:hypothetical protein
MLPNYSLQYQVTYDDDVDDDDTTDEEKNNIRKK